MSVTRPNSGTAKSGKWIAPSRGGYSAVSVPSQKSGERKPPKLPGSSSSGDSKKSGGQK